MNRNPRCALLLVAALAPCSAVAQHAPVPVLDWPIEVVSEGHGFTEGPAIAADGWVYFSDLDHGRILRFDPDTHTTTTWNDDSRKSNGLLIVGDTLYACEAAGRAVTRYDLTRGPSSRRVLADRFEGQRFGSPNDIAVVGDQLVFSSFYWKGVLDPANSAREIQDNRCYILSLADHSITALPHAFQTPNGVVYDPSRQRLYLGEMQGNRIYVARADKDGIGPAELFFDLASIGKGRPDGMAVDHAGRLYVALYGMSDQLLILSPDAVPIGVLPSGPKTSNCTLTADGRILYLTADHKLKRVIVRFP
jgi:gluconolactonase